MSVIFPDIVDPDIIVFPYPDIMPPCVLFIMLSVAFIIKPLIIMLPVPACMLFCVAPFIIVLCPDIIMSDPHIAKAAEVTVAAPTSSTEVVSVVFIVR